MIQELIIQILLQTLPSTNTNYLFTSTKTGYKKDKSRFNKFTDLNITLYIPKMENVGNVQLTVYDADGLTTYQTIMHCKKNM